MAEPGTESPALETRPACCGECGGLLRLSSGANRLRSYRGHPFELPEDFEFQMCPSCGAEWMTGNEIDQLTEIIAKALQEVGETDPCKLRHVIGEEWWHAMQVSDRSSE